MNYINTRNNLCVLTSKTTATGRQPPWIQYLLQKNLLIKELVSFKIKHSRMTGSWHKHTKYCCCLTYFIQAFCTTTYKEPVPRSQGTTRKEHRVLEHSELFLDLHTLPMVCNLPNLTGRGPDSVLIGQNTFNLLKVNLTIPYHPQRQREVSFPFLIVTQSYISFVSCDTGRTSTSLGDKTKSSP